MAQIRPAELHRVRFIDRSVSPWIRGASLAHISVEYYGQPLHRV